MNFILIFFFFRKILIFPLFSQLRLNITFKFTIIFIDNKKDKLNLNFKKNNNINNIFFKYQEILLGIVIIAIKKNLKIYKFIRRI